MTNDNQSPEAAASKPQQPANDEDQKKFVAVTLSVTQWRAVVAALGNAGTFNQMAPLLTSIHQQVSVALASAKANRQQRRAADRRKK